MDADTGEHRPDGVTAPDGPTGAERPRWADGLADEVCAGVRSLTPDPGPPARPGAARPATARPARHVVVLPGMGALGYLLPVLRALAAGGARASLLDLPGFGRRGPLASAPTVRGVAAAAARWCTALPPDVELVLVGHSTGAVSALLAALELEAAGRPPAAVVLASPVPAPGQRSLPRMLARVPLAYRRDSPAELAVLADYRRAGRDALALLRSALAERPERLIRDLRSPVLVTAGRSDAFAPPGWLVALAHAAPSRLARMVRLPGSHNNPYTHPDAVADAVTALADEAGSRRRRRTAGARG